MRLPPPPRHPSLLSQLRGSGLGLPCPIWQVRGEPKACQNVGGISNPAADRQRLGSPLIRGEAAQQRESLPRRHQDPRDRTRRPAQAWDAHALYRTAWGGGRTPSPRRGPPPPQRPPLHFPFSSWGTEGPDGRRLHSLLRERVPVAPPSCDCLCCYTDSCLSTGGLSPAQSHGVRTIAPPFQMRKPRPRQAPSLAGDHL